MNIFIGHYRKMLAIWEDQVDPLIDEALKNPALDGWIDEAGNGHIVRLDGFRFSSRQCDVIAERISGLIGGACWVSI